MSYILDALKKADAQRERDPARGIHAQPAPLSTGTRQSHGGYRAWFWGYGAAGLVVLAAVAWYFYRGQEAVVVRTGPSTAVAPQSVPVPVTAAVPVAAQPAPVATAVMPPPPPTTLAVNEPARDARNTSQPMMRGRQQLAQAAPAAGAAPVAPPSAAPAASAIAAAPAAPAADVSGPARAPAAAASAATIAPVPPRPTVTAPSPPPPRALVIVPTPPAVGLPPDAPKLVITGGVYSTNPAQRMLIVNGQVFNQGADLGSGVTLEEIKPKAAVLTFRGARYSVAY